VRPDRVVLPPPSLDQHLRLLEREEDLPVEQLIPQLAVEALHIAVLPRAPRLDEEGLCTDSLQPAPDHLRSELRTVVGAYVFRNALEDEQFGEQLEHIIRSDPSGHLDGQALSGELVDQGK